MEFCPHCGSEVETEYGEVRYTCSSCKQKLHLSDLVSHWTLNARIKQLRAMNTLMCNCNHEGIYERWIYLMPDGATEEDLFNIALSEKDYNECFDLFLKLVAENGMRW